MNIMLTVVIAYILTKSFCMPYTYSMLLIKMKPVRNTSNQSSRFFAHTFRQSKVINWHPRFFIHWMIAVSHWWSSTGGIGILLNIGDAGSVTASKPRVSDPSKDLSNWQSLLPAHRSNALLTRLRGVCALHECHQYWDMQPLSRARGLWGVLLRVEKLLGVFVELSQKNRKLPILARISGHTVVRVFWIRYVMREDRQLHMSAPPPLPRVQCLSRTLLWHLWSLAESDDRLASMVRYAEKGSF